MLFSSMASENLKYQLPILMTAEIKKKKKTCNVNFEATVGQDDGLL